MKLREATFDENKGLDFSAFVTGNVLSHPVQLDLGRVKFITGATQSTGKGAGTICRRGLEPIHTMQFPPDIFPACSAKSSQLLVCPDMPVAVKKLSSSVLDPSTVRALIPLSVAAWDREGGGGVECKRLVVGSLRWHILSPPA